jgi:16S rRNA processing protein RimM
VRGGRGVHGEIKIDPLSDAPERFQPGATVHAAGVPRIVRQARQFRDLVLLELAGIETRERADELTGTLLEVPEAELSQLEEGRYYRHQIVGLEVFDEAGSSLGRVDQVLETGANDVFVTRSGDSELLIPAIDTVIREVDVPRGRIVVRLLPGLERTPAKARARRPVAKRARS